MNSEEIRKEPVSYGFGIFLREIAAQLSELNETLKAKSFTATCDAHLHVYGDESERDGRE